jgi:hypothetical protein
MASKRLSFIAIVVSTSREAMASIVAVRTSSSMSRPRCKIISARKMRKEASERDFTYYD